jgi:hypothetical protein
MEACCVQTCADPVAFVVFDMTDDAWDLFQKRRNLVKAIQNHHDNEVLNVAYTYKSLLWIEHVSFERAIKSTLSVDDLHDLRNNKPVELSEDVELILSDELMVIDSQIICAEDKFKFACVAHGHRAETAFIRWEEVL